MSLKVHEDTKGQSQCELLFHFYFPKIKDPPPQNSNDPMMRQKYDWDVSKQPVQHLYLSKDTTKLMEVINGYIATIYIRVNKATDDSQPHEFEEADLKHMLRQRPVDNGQQVEWLELARIRAYPRMLAQMTSVPFLFSPNFKFQLDFDYQSKQLIILRVRTQKVYLRVPTDLIDTIWNGMAGMNSLYLIFSRIRWESDFINKESQAEGEADPSP